MELRRNEKITFRCTELEKDALAEQAARCSLSVSEYCRSLSLGGRPRDKLRQYSDTLRLHRAACSA
ncbi:MULTISPECIES: plasmid mobilization protein, partial [Bacteroidales]